MTSKESLSRREFLKGGAAAVAGGLAIAGCAPGAIPVATPGAPPSAAPSEEQAVEEGEKLTIYFNTHGSVDISFWAAANHGFQAFCERHNVDGRYVGTVRDGDIAEERANLDRIIAAGDADAVLQVISSPETLDEPLRKLHEQGVPVIAVNSKDPRPPEEKVPYLRYVGEDTYNVGRRNALEALKSFKKLAGRPPQRSAYLVHVPGVWVLATRGQGMRDVLEPEGVIFDEVAVEVDPAKTQEIVRAYVEANPDVETIHTGWSRPAAWAIEALTQMDRLGNVNEPFEEGKIFVTSIDLDVGLLEMISAGDCVGTIDQQVYLQGWYGAALAYHWVTNRFLPANDISTGPFWVDQDNADELIEQAQKGIRA